MHQASPNASSTPPTPVDGHVATATIHYALVAQFDLNGADPESLRKRLDKLLNDAICSGEIPFDTEDDSTGCIVDYHGKATLVTPIAADLEEDQVAEWIGQQLESGSMSLEEIPRLMARYALAESNEMREELAERMGMTEVVEPALRERS